MLHFIRFLGAASLFVATFGADVHAQSIAADPDFENWVRIERQLSFRNLLENITHPEVRPGAVIASPSKQNPNYFFHWVRDGALTMDVVNLAYSNARTPEQKTFFFDRMHKFVQFSRLNQVTPNRSGDLGQALGEPKFHVDGSAFNNDWGRPQNDGPALRALTLTHFARILLENNGEQYVRDWLYDSDLPTHTVIKVDLEYIANNWFKPSVDLWEEVGGLQFYTMMVQRRALFEGADLADQLRDNEAANFYRSRARDISRFLDRYWSVDATRIVPTLNRNPNGPVKGTQLDVAVILAVLHGARFGESFGPLDDRVLSTAVWLKAAFNEEYEINRNEDSAATLFGRYPGDTYDGINTNGHGNPWFLATFAYAELLYKIVSALQIAPSIIINDLNLPFYQRLLSDRVLEKGILQNHDETFRILIRALFQEADLTLARGGSFMLTPDGRMSEQINRDRGVQQGAKDLTWSYASFMTATEARKQAQNRAAFFFTR